MPRFLANVADGSGLWIKKSGFQEEDPVSPAEAVLKIMVREGRWRPGG